MDSSSTVDESTTMDYQNPTNNELSLQPMLDNNNANGNEAQTSMDKQKNSEAICTICKGNHGLRYSPQHVCRHCKLIGHSKRDCILLECTTCKQQGHTSIKCGKACKKCGEWHIHRPDCPPVYNRKIYWKHKEILEQQQQNKTCSFCQQKGHSKGECNLLKMFEANKKIQCGCEYKLVQQNRFTTKMKQRIYHCCNCKFPETKETINEIVTLRGQNKLYCYECQFEVAKLIQHKDPQRIEIFKRLEKENIIRQCQFCKRTNLKRKMFLEDTMAFCSNEEKYGYQVYTDLKYNLNYKLEERIHHYCY